MKEINKHTMIVRQISAYLSITTYGIKHYYGSIWYNNSKVPILRELDEAGVRELCDAGYKVGDQTIRFNDQASIIDVAKHTWKLHFPSAKVLVLGGSGYIQPQRVLACINENYTEANNALWYRLEKLYNKIGTRNMTPRELQYFDGICDRWDIINQQYWGNSLEGL